MNYGIGALKRLDLKWNFFKFRFKRFFERQIKIDLNKYVQDVVCIHLKKRKDRYKQMKREASRIKLNDGNLWEKIRIKDGVDVNDKQITKSKSFNPNYMFQSHYEVDPHPNWKDHENIEIRCSNPEAGCTMSHISVWQDIVQRNTPHTLILEDDFFFDTEFQKKFIKVLSEVPKDFDLFYLSTLPTHHGFTWDPHSENVIEIHNGVWWLSGYILSLEGAKKLVNNFPVCGPGDMWINHQFKNMKVYSTISNLIGQRPNTKSDNVYSFEKIFRYW